MSFSASRLAAALAARLDLVVPRPFSVCADEDDVVVEHPEGWGFTTRIGTLFAPDAAAGGDDRTEAARADTAVGGVLNSLQDAVSEASAEPWPPLPGARMRAMAPYGTRYDGDALHFWYGPTEAAPVLAFEPIPFAALVDRTSGERDPRAGGCQRGAP